MTLFFSLIRISIRSRRLLYADLGKDSLQAAHFVDSFFLKVSVDQLSQNLYVPIKNQQGGGVDISSFSWKEDWRQKDTFVKYRQNQG
jgi:hypothetical protein